MEHNPSMDGNGNLRGFCSTENLRAGVWGKSRQPYLGARIGWARARASLRANLAMSKDYA